jgi:[ribosomal protein S18]-alanine N-acetyltransferase
VIRFPVPACDIDALMAVMEAAFDPAYGEAWTRRQVEDALLIGNCHYFLVNDQGTPRQEDEPAAGFYLSRTGYEEEELLLFAVAPPYRRQGIGSVILDHLFAHSRQRGAHRLLLEMRRGNPAEALYNGKGFLIIGERRDYYRTSVGTRIDAITFACALS